MTRQRRSPKKKREVSLAPRIAGALLAALLIAAGAEAFVRQFGVYNTNTMFRPHPVLFWELTPNLRGFTHEAAHFKEVVSTSSLGFRGREVPPKEPGELRVLCLGDSSTFGHGVKDDETYPARLEALLRLRCPGRKVTVINGGVQGYTSFQGLYALREKGMALRPDVVTLAFLNNDVTADIMPDSRRTPSGLARAVKTLLFRSQLYLLLRNVSVEAEVKRLSERPCPSARVPLEEYRRNLEELVACARAGGAKAVLVSMPRDRATTAHEDYRRVLHEMSAREGIPLADCFASWGNGGKESLYLDMVHPNPEGQKALAGELLKALEKGKVLSQI